MPCSCQLVGDLHHSLRAYMCTTRQAWRASDTNAFAGPGRAPMRWSLTTKQVIVWAHQVVMLACSSPGLASVGSLSG
jgi:hypothetical protein